MQNQKVPPSLLPPVTQGGEDHFLLQRRKRGFLENGMSFCRASAVSHRIPETLECLGRNSDMQQGPRATTRGAREGQSLSLCQCLNWVVHFIYFK